MAGPLNVDVLALGLWQSVYFLAVFHNFSLTGYVDFPLNYFETSLYWGLFSQNCGWLNVQIIDFNFVNIPFTYIGLFIYKYYKKYYYKMGNILQVLFISRERVRDRESEQEGEIPL